MPADFPPPANSRFARIVLAIYGLVWAALAIGVRDWPTWALENILVVIAVGLLVATHKRFPFSNASYVLIAVYSTLHAYGARYGYAHTPLGDWAKSAMGLGRNYYDRAIHGAFGLLLVVPIREIFLRSAGVSHRAAGWLAWAMVLAASSIFEIVESIIAEIVSPGAGLAWLGAQGDEWDAQQDMFAATVGAGIALAVAWWKQRGRPLAAPPAMVPSRPFRERRFIHMLCVVYAIVWIVAAISPVDRRDWLLENLLVFLWMPFLILSYRRRAMSDFSYALIFVFLLLHVTGAHYTYAEVPFGYWLRDTFGFARNHFDRIVHFGFGFLVTIPLCDLLRFGRLRPFWAAFLPAMVIVSWSGFFEILEAVVAMLVNPELGQAYLGTQGDVWDGQKDMALATLGAALSAPFARRITGGKIGAGKAK